MVQWVPTEGRCPKCLPHGSFATNSCTLSMFQSLSMLCRFLKNVLGKVSSDQWQESPLLHYFIFCCLSTWIVKMSRWPQQCENDSTSWSFQTLAFAMIWNCWETAPLLKCSDTVCLSSIKTSKNLGTSETCTTCKSLRVLAFQGSENCRTLGYKQEEEHVASIEKPRTSGTCGLLGWCHLSTKNVLCDVFKDAKQNKVCRASKTTEIT